MNFRELLFFLYPDSENYPDYVRSDIIRYPSVSKR
nr:MAG TPA: hypothetical protein [Caudoviricetes sp.]